MITKFIVALLGGLSIAMLYFMIASGFSLIFGLERIVNFAHGSLFMLGAFLSYEVYNITSSLALGVIVAGISMAVLGAVLERGLLKRKFGQELEIILLTIGFMYIIRKLALIQWGQYEYTYTNYWLLGKSLHIGDMSFPWYRILIVILGFAIAISIKMLLDRTDLGLVVRAGINDVDMAEALGANTKRTFTIVFAIGCALAGIGGAAAVGWEDASVQLGLDYLFFAFAIVVIGGRGSFEGTFYAAVLAGVLYSMASWYIEPYVGGTAQISIFVLMALILLLKPSGLGGSAGGE